LLHLNEADARSLLVHCGEEMPHLASFLPALHAEFSGGHQAVHSNSDVKG
jgi:hypothetical protein